MKKILPILVVAALAVGGWFWWQQRNAGEADGLTLYGNVDIRQVALAFDGSGRITELAAQEGDRVRAGEVIARLDMQALQLQAKAQEAVVEAQRQALLQLQAGSRPEEIAQARAKVASAKASAELANLQRDRAARLVTSRTASQQDLDRTESEAKAANAAVDQDSAALDLILAGARPEEIAAAEAKLREAEAQLELLRHNIALGELRAPADAVIRSRLREPGDMASAQSPVYALALTDPKWIRVYVREADLGRIRPGMAAQIVTDSFPDQPVAGVVGYISSVAEFTPKSVQTEELRTSLVYEVHINVADKEDRLRLGQPVTVRLDDGAAP
ncbi:HlyD family efflux transporter periplasmic adaptor subunit [Paracoccus aestuariivivens]|uniref:HlyD family efflux transporter periplasmic adaptor subunit n=1 Tax=Paracoccus aestuariivivens TaxID=1820333 RepID=A0A6L6JAB5_9RHOB|nr:HlyD family efflux transporter periplasmic adaptor subunit [Paracoccus aestuariivivens]MTH78496.1 HlyD family efflux transporter periplasmic adaptor subunit [Paracoccus aestuariivivens]